MFSNNSYYQNHLIISITAYVVCAFLDAFFTLEGMQGNLLLEGNPVMRYMMQTFGLIGGLVIQKSLILLLAFLLARTTYIGIDKESKWVYNLALTPVTKRWMKQKKRFIVAFLPLYLVALSQGIAALSWIYLITVFRYHQ